MYCFISITRRYIYITLEIQSRIYQVPEEGVTVGCEFAVLFDHALLCYFSPWDIFNYKHVHFLARLLSLGLSIQVTSDKAQSC